jgi:hypothetical protein
VAISFKPSNHSNHGNRKMADFKRLRQPRRSLRLLHFHDGNHWHGSNQAGEQERGYVHPSAYSDFLC